MQIIKLLCVIFMIVWVQKVFDNRSEKIQFAATETAR